tara:strand:+ start:304 stop:516 length:213 start_codon:yes stop_codon:yes gene_type:complete
MPKFKKTFTDRTGYDIRLLTPGFGGELDDDELDALKEELLRRPGLRERWGFGEKDRITKKKIQKIALDGV